MKQDIVDAARAALGAPGAAITLGAVVHDGECHPEPPVRLPLSMMNRHSLIAGASGIGTVKTHSLPLTADQLSAQGELALLANIKGDRSATAARGQAHDRATTRATETG